MKRKSGVTLKNESHIVYAIIDIPWRVCIYCNMLLFSCLVLSDSSRSHWLQHTRLHCPLPSPRVCPSSCSLHQWCHSAISSSDALLSFYPQSFPTSGSFPVRWLFASDGQSIEASASASASVLPVSIQGWFPLGLTSLISLIWIYKHPNILEHLSPSWPTVTKTSQPHIV